MNKRQLQILLDLDGVLVNLSDRVQSDLKLSGCQRHAFDRHELDRSMTLKEIWGHTDAAWWESLDWMDDGRLILRTCEDAVGPENVFICTSPAAWPGSAEGKLAWMRYHLHDYYWKRRYIITPAKHCCAAPHNMLIDDHPPNIERFRDWGGAALLVPREWNCDDPEYAPHYIERTVFGLLDT